MGFSLNISSLSPDILLLHLALPPVFTSQIFYPEAILCCISLFHLLSTTLSLLFITHLNISCANCSKIL